MSTLNFLGVPQLLNAIPLAATSLLPSDIAGGVNAFRGVQWGIYNGLTPVVVAESVLTFDFSQDQTIPEYPIEEGGFASYSKVQTPYAPRLRFTSTGASQFLLLSSIEAIVNDTNLYTVVTDLRVYPNVNVIHYSYQKSNQNGANRLIVDVNLREVRVASNAAPVGFSSPRMPAAASLFNGGTVQAVSALANQITSLPSIL